MNFLKFPLVRITLYFVLGLLVAFYFNPDFWVGFTASLIGFLLFLLNFLGVFKKKQSYFFEFSIFVFSVGIGIFNPTLHDDLLNKNHYFHQISDENQIVHFTLDTKLKPNTYNYRYFAKVNLIDNQKSNGKILINLSKKHFSEEPEIGSTFAVYTKIIRNSIVKNPGQFDYGAYLERQKIYAQVYTDSINIQRLETKKTTAYHTYKIRNKILNNLRKSGFSEGELAILHALILGQKQDISPEILQSYQYAGAVHILSVSGLHVAYIYLFLSFILQFIPGHRKGRLLKLSILLLSLWSFALLAGMAPAIVRAVTMFSFVAIGRFIDRNTHIIYTLIISVLFILLCNPSFLFDVGFQLSYFALFFIVWTKPVFDQFYQAKNNLMQYVWDVITVSFAAQIGVLPLSLYYFNQFPTLFMITNLLVLFPLSILMIYGIILCGLALLGTTNFYLSKIMELGIKYINEVSLGVARFEDFVFTDVSFSMPMLVVWYALIFSFFVWIQRPKFRNFILFLGSVLLLQTIYILNQINIKNSEKFIIFNKNKNTLFSEVKSDEMNVFTRDSISENDYLIKNYKVRNFIKTIKQNPLKNLYYFNEKKIMVVDHATILELDLSADIVVLVNSPKINLERFLQNHQPEIVISDASNYKSYVERWKQTCQKHNVRFHSTYENGFYGMEK